jgi:hypothetical protein
LTALFVTLLTAGLLTPPATHAQQTHPPIKPPLDRAVPIWDGARYWSEADRATMNATIQDIFRRYHFHVVVETYMKRSDARASKADFFAWAQSRREELEGNPPVSSMVIISCREPNGTDWSIRTYLQVHRLGDELRKQSKGRHLQTSLPDILAFLGDALEAFQPTPGGPGRADGNAALDVAVRKSAGRAAFTSAAQAAGLSAADATALLADRGPASCEDLTAFLNDQVKTGRRGNDLKSDLQTFIRVFKEKSRE